MEMNDLSQIKMFQKKEIISSLLGLKKVFVFIQSAIKFSHSGYDIGTPIMSQYLENNNNDEVIFKGKVLDFITEIKELLANEVAQMTLFKCKN